MVHDPKEGTATPRRVPRPMLLLYNTNLPSYEHNYSLCPFNYIKKPYILSVCTEREHHLDFFLKSIF